LWAGRKTFPQQKGGPGVTREKSHPHPSSACPETALVALAHPAPATLVVSALHFPVPLETPGLAVRGKPVVNGNQNCPHFGK